MLKQIKTRVDDTNGRVTSLEKWRNRFIGAMSVIVTVLLPIALWAIKSGLL
jgi:hypothetical protein